MTGAPPYNPQSPTQQSRYPVYSPPTKSRPYYANNEQYQQHPPQTPPAFSSRSPHFSHAPSPLPGTLPPLNGAAPPSSHPSEPPSQYQAHSSAGNPPFALPRPYPGSVLSGNGASPYGHSTPSHAHPAGRPDSHPQTSPKKETDSQFSMGTHGVMGYPSSSAVREPRASSPPKDVVCYPLVSHGHISLHID